MKKFLLLVFSMIALAVSSATAQTVESSRFFDNWSLGLKGGAVTPMKNAAFWGDMRGVVGINLQKNITPTWGLGIEGQWSVNTSSWQRFMPSTTAFDHQMIGVYSTTNLMNLFGGYKGTPRVFEIDIELGVGWLHAYMNNHKVLFDELGAATFNSWYTKFGPNFNFNLGKSKAWTIGIKPSFVYNMNYPNSTGYDIRHGYFEILAGVTYHFKNKNGTHSFTLYDDSELLYELACLNDVNKHMAERIAWLENQPPQIEIVEKIVEVENVTEPITMIGNAIGFNLNSAEVLPTNFASLENIANIMKEDEDLKLNIVGFSSAKEGSEAYNLILSQHRSDNVKKVLVEEFGIDENRLNAIGKGSAIQLWRKNDWNRTVVFEVVE